MLAPVEVSRVSEVMCWVSASLARLSWAYAALCASIIDSSQTREKMAIKMYISGRFRSIKGRSRPLPPLPAPKEATSTKKITFYISGFVYQRSPAELPLELGGTRGSDLEVNKACISYGFVLVRVRVRGSTPQKAGGTREVRLPPNRGRDVPSPSPAFFALLLRVFPKHPKLFI